MAEVLTAIEVALCISGVVKSLHDYINEVKDAKDDIRRLTQELFALKGTLEHFDAHSDSHADESVHSQVQPMLQMTQATLETLQARLSKQKSKLSRAVGRLTWPFKSEEIQKHIDCIERSKTWFIMVILKDSSDRTVQVYDEMKKLASIISQDITERQAATMIRETDELLKWLAPSDAEGHLALATKNRIPGTGKWFLGGRAREWLYSPDVEQPFVWITGKSGAGKTMLFSSIVEDLQELCDSTASSIGYHCCSLDNAVSQPVSNIFGSILAQLCRARPELCRFVQRYRHSVSSLIPQNDLTFDQICSIFKPMSESTEILYVLVDALNETPHQEQVVEALSVICSSNSNVRALVTCTRGPPLGYPLIREFVMPLGDVGHDIDLYVNHRLTVEPSFRGLNPNIHEEIRKVIGFKADGMFRWAKLSMDRLALLRTGRDVRDALSDMPMTLNATYEGILGRIAEHDREIAREALLWLCFSLRPLTLFELAEAVVLRESDSHIDSDSRLTDPSVLLDICQGLVTGSGNNLKSNTLTLAHDSVRSFLISPQIRQTSAAYFAINESEAHSRIMRKCLTYLQLETFVSGPVTDRFQFHERLESYPLLSYATFHWPIHSEGFSMSSEDEDLVLSFFSTKELANGSSFESWVQLLLDTTSMDLLRQTDPLYYAASFNMTSILKLLLRPDLQIDIEKPGGRFSSPPLFVAIWRGNRDAAKLLLLAGADPDAQDGGMGLTCRELAARREDSELLELMENVAKEPRSSRVLPLRLNHG